MTTTALTVRPGTRGAKTVASGIASAVEALGPLEPGCRVIGVTKGQFSLLDLIRAVLDQTGPADLTVSTWTVGVRDADNAEFLATMGAIRSLRFLVDRSFVRRQPEYARRLVESFGVKAIRATNTHAKFAMIAAGDWRIVIRSSMNLNRNPRFEQFDLDDDPAIFDFFERHVSEMEELMPPGLKPRAADVWSGYERALGGGVSDELARQRHTADKRSGWGAF